MISKNIRTTTASREMSRAIEVERLVRAFACTRALEGAAPKSTQMNMPLVTVYVGHGLNTDLTRGVFDRFSALAIPRWMPLARRILADVVKQALCIALLLAVGCPLGLLFAAGRGTARRDLADLDHLHERIHPDDHGCIEKAPVRAGALDQPADHPAAAGRIPPDAVPDQRRPCGRPR